MFTAFHNTCNRFFGPFDSNICNYIAGAAVIVQLLEQETSAWIPLSKSEFGGGLGRVTSVGGSVTSPCVVLLRPLAFPPQKGNNLLRWHSANKPRRVCVAVLH